MFQYSAVALEPGESVSFGDGIAISLDGNHAYSITGWIRLRALGNDVYVLTKGAEFVIFLNNGVLGAQMVNRPRRSRRPTRWSSANGTASRSPTARTARAVA
jgi:hypothetical protein